MERDQLKSTQSKLHREQGIAYISRSQMVIFIQGMQNIITIPFSPEVVRDLDLIDQQKLTALIQNTITQQKLPLATLTLLLANDLLFAKQLMSNDPKEQLAEEQSFVDMVPYEEVVVQKIPFNNAVYITVANKELIDGITKALEANNFTSPLVLAAYIFSKEINFASQLQPQALTLLMQKFNNFRQFNFLKTVAPPIPDLDKSPNQQNIENNNTQQQSKPPQKSNRIVVLVGIFIMLIGILVAVYLWSSQSNQPVRSSEITPTPTTVTAPVPSSSVASPSGDVQGQKDIKVTLQYPGDSSQNALLIEESLEESGFTEIIKSESSSTTSTIISFNNNIPQTTKNKVINAVSRVYSKVIVQNSNTFDNPITIQLGND